MLKRGSNHNSPMDKLLATGLDYQDENVDSINRQKKFLKKKLCKCDIGAEPWYNWPFLAYQANS